MLLHRSLSTHAIALASGKKASQYLISWRDKKGKNHRWKDCKICQPLIQNALYYPWYKWFLPAVVYILVILDIWWWQLWNPSLFVSRRNKCRQVNMAMTCNQYKSNQVIKCITVVWMIKMLSVKLFTQHFYSEGKQNKQKNKNPA